MILKLRTLKQISRALAFLRAEQERRLRVQWTLGPVTEQRALVGVAHGSSFTTRPLSRESAMRLVISDSQKCGLSVSAVDKRGHAAQVENVRWDVSDASLLSIETDPIDPLKATVTAVGPIGSGQVNVTGDAQLGDGETPIAATLDVDVIAGAAVGFTVTTGTPEEQA